MDKIFEVTKKVNNILSKDTSGHGADHVARVLHLSQDFALKEGANYEITSLIALLHDVDDYKLVGLEKSVGLPNAKKIMHKCNIDSLTAEIVIEEIEKIGYSKRLKGIHPQTLEGKIVSDADMCDALGMIGIIRTAQYQFKHNSPFFDRKKFPIIDMTESKYTRTNSDSAICHMFEKILKLKKLMLTNSGKDEAKSRHENTVNFMRIYFNEENAYDWLDFLDSFLKEEYNEIEN